MTKDSTYQGWRNYETWCAALWMNNDYGFGTEVTEYISTITTDGDYDDLTGELACYLQNYAEEITPDLGASMAADLLNYAIEQVDFYEIADTYLMAAGD